MTFPATRAMNSSPNPASKMSSGGTRESLQPMLGQDLFLHGRKSSLAADEALVAGYETEQRFIGGVSG
jgi:hypothetical protein